MRAGTRLALLASLLCLAVIARQVDGLGRPAIADVATPLPATPSGPAGFTLPPIEQFGVVTERPLFRADRRPLAAPRQPPPMVVATPAAAPPAPPPSTDLIGIVRAGDARTAVFRDPTGKTRRLHEGGEIDGWSIIAIEENKVILSNEGRVTELRPNVRRQGIPGFPLPPGVPAPPFRAPPAPVAQ